MLGEDSNRSYIKKCPAALCAAGRADGAHISGATRIARYVAIENDMRNLWRALRDWYKGETLRALAWWCLELFPLANSQAPWQTARLMRPLRRFWCSRQAGCCRPRTSGNSPRPCRRARLMLGTHHIADDCSCSARSTSSTRGFFTLSRHPWEGLGAWKASEKLPSSLDDTHEYSTA